MVLGMNVCKINRRNFFGLQLGWLAAAVTGGVGVTADAGEAIATPFSFDALRARAENLAKSAYAPMQPPAPDFTDVIDFDKHQSIQFQAEQSLWQDQPNAFAVRFFHLHQMAPTPVKINVVKSGMAKPYRYKREMFDYSGAEIDKPIPEDLGFAGFRVMNNDGGKTDWLAFQGASYFRSSGEDNQYGISARGIAANTAHATREEFPIFTEFWLEAGAGEVPSIVIYALLEGDSLTGAYRFEARQANGAIMDVHAALFIRNDVPRLGIAPLTSMYWFGENTRRQAVDWRPEIHDSDGLAIWTGSNERIFRPIVNPPTVQVNSFLDNNPKGFGLVQRDRAFENYQDDGAFYHRRPSVWVEPIGDWGEGEVQLVEIPTDDEIYDNIVAFWRPRKPAKAGDSLEVDYRLHWRNLQPYPPHEIAQVLATRIGRGGIPGQPRTIKENLKKFVIDFQGGPLSTMKARFDIEPVVTASRGDISNQFVIKVVGTDRWRAFFDIAVTDEAPVDLRCFLRLEDKTLSETWLYQYFPRWT